MTDNNKGRPVISADGLAKLEEELSYYKLVKRKEIAEQIKTAIAFGDLSENAEYDEAKNEQARIEGHISQLENMLRTAVVVDHTDVSIDAVGVGTLVRVQDMKIGATEADPLEGRISNESPVGAALLGAKTGGEVSFAVPDGMRTLKVLEIRRD